MSGVPTPSQTIGPFFSFGMSWLAGRDLVPAGTPGSVVLAGRVLDGDGAPVPDAMVELHQGDAEGRHPASWRGFGRALTDADGRYRLVTVKPGLRRGGDDGQAPHIDVSVFARGLLQRLVTRVYFPDEAVANAADPLLAAIGDAERVATLVARPGDGGLVFDIRLQGPGETVFLAW